MIVEGLAGSVGDMGRGYNVDWSVNGEMPRQLK